MAASLFASKPAPMGCGPLITKTELLDEISKEVGHISNVEVAEMISKNEKFTLLDIREMDQTKHGEIFHNNLVQLTRGYLELKIEEFVKDKKEKIVIYCCTGQRSILAAKSLNKLGYSNVYSMEGGLKKWVDDGFVLDTVYGEMKLVTE